MKGGGERRVGALRAQVQNFWSRSESRLVRTGEERGPHGVVRRRGSVLALLPVDHQPSVEDAPLPRPDVCAVAGSGRGSRQSYGRFQNGGHTMVPDADHAVRSAHGRAQPYARLPGMPVWGQKSFCRRSVEGERECRLQSWRRWRSRDRRRRLRLREGSPRSGTAAPVVRREGLWRRWTHGGKCPGHRQLVDRPYARMGESSWSCSLSSRA